MSEKMPNQYNQAALDVSNQAVELAVQAQVPESHGRLTTAEQTAAIRESGIHMDTDYSYDTMVATHDARLMVANDGQSANITKAETTGKYEAAVVRGESTPVRISRNDGEGGKYQSRLTGENAQKATEILARRAARSIGTRATKHALGNSEAA